MSPRTKRETPERSGGLCPFPFGSRLAATVGAAQAKPAASPCADGWRYTRITSGHSFTSQRPVRLPLHLQQMKSESC